LLGAKRTTITVHRSEEILPRDPVAAVGGVVSSSSQLARQGTSVSSGEDASAFDAEFGEGGSERYYRLMLTMNLLRSEGEGGEGHCCLAAGARILERSYSFHPLWPSLLDLPATLQLGVLGLAIYSSIYMLFIYTIYIHILNSHNTVVSGYKFKVYVYRRTRRCYRGAHICSILKSSLAAA